MWYFSDMKTLFIVATPIGNLEDITLRALRVLKEVDLIACEDTRVTKRLLDKYQIIKPTLSYHQHSQVGRLDKIIAALESGKDVALVSDAGTPGIADPGGMLVSAARTAGVKVVAIPGPSALVAALSISGIAADRFLFLGFLPHKKGRQTLLQTAADSTYPVVFYESVHRIKKTLEQLSSLLSPERPVIVCRELTKIYEEVAAGPISEVLSHFDEKNTKGEFVVIIDGSK